MSIVNSIKEISDIIIPILVAIIGFLGLKTIAYKVSLEIFTSAVRWIKDLEKDSNLSGPEKMKLVISYIKNLLPRFSKVIFSDKVIKSMAESVFDDMQKYSENRVARKTGMSWNEMLKAVEESQSTDVKESGLYTFKDGTTMRYVGEFEKSLLEYMDSHGMVPEAPANNIDVNV